MINGRTNKEYRAGNKEKKLQKNYIMKKIKKKLIKIITKTTIKTKKDI